MVKLWVSGEAGELRDVELSNTELMAMEYLYRENHHKNDKN
jgi:hypothetical protein